MNTEDVEMRKDDLTLYLVTDSTGMAEDAFLKKVEMACDGGVTMIQLREKERCGSEFIELALKVKRISDEHGIPFIINDRIDVAMATDASGVHLGQSDIPVRYARKMLGDDKIIGASTKTVPQAMKALEEGADYLGVGAIYPTTTKVVTAITEVSVLNDIAVQTGLPVVAIGGLNSTNIHVLYESKADGIAVVSAIMKSHDPKRTSADLKEQVLRNFRSKAADI